MSLKDKLNKWIQKKGEVKHEDVKFACENNFFGKKYKISTAERRLRPSESPEVETVERNGAIYLYKIKE
jgi:hypothetical protein